MAGNDREDQDSLNFREDWDEKSPEGKRQRDVAEADLKDSEGSQVDGEVSESGVNASPAQGESKKEEQEYEDVCFICRRPESKAGRMFKLPNHICVCDDCMHKTMDTVSQFDYQGLLNPPFQGDDNNTTGQKGFPKISFVNLADLQSIWRICRGMEESPISRS